MRRGHGGTAANDSHSEYAWCNSVVTLYILTQHPINLNSIEWNIRLYDAFTTKCAVDKLQVKYYDPMQEDDFSWVDNRSPQPHLPPPLHLFTTLYLGRFSSLYDNKFISNILFI